MIILSSVIVLCAIALAASLLLYVCSKKFAVKTDPRVNDVHECLPKANCGGCGFAGCQSLAQAIVKAADEGGDMPTCPVGGNDVMSKIYALLGVENKAGTGKKRVATLKCAGCDLAPIATYDGLRTCDAMNRCGSGESACGYGCLGCGDCANACDFGGITINPYKHIPEVDPDVCVACGSCVKACPRHLLEIRQVGVKNRMVVVACSNHDRGPIAMKVCGHSCIGCGKCAKECPFGAITIDGNVATIDSEKCRMCRKCVAVCPRKAIVASGFPPAKPAMKTQATNTDKTAQD